VEVLVHPFQAVELLRSQRILRDRNEIDIALVRLEVIEGNGAGEVHALDAGG
jgi:hypothetical protein